MYCFGLARPARQFCNKSFVVPFLPQRPHARDYPPRIVARAPRPATCSGWCSAWSELPPLAARAGASAGCSGCPGRPPIVGPTTSRRTHGPPLFRRVRTRWPPPVHALFSPVNSLVSPHRQSCAHALAAQSLAAALTRPISRFRDEPRRL
jgi:hypothetical protein